MAGEDLAMICVGTEAEAVSSAVEVSAEVGLSIAGVSDASGADGSVGNLGASRVFGVVIGRDAVADNVNVGGKWVGDVGFIIVFAVDSDIEGVADVLTGIGDSRGNFLLRLSEGNLIILWAYEGVGSICVG